MKFFSRELCEKLQKLGCKSENWFYWNVPMSQSILRPSYLPNSTGRTDAIPAFSQNDFTGCHEQAWQNAEIVWGNYDVKQHDFCCHGANFSCGESREVLHWGWKDNRKMMIDADDAEEFLKRTMQNPLDEMIQENQENGLYDPPFNNPLRRD